MKALVVALALTFLVAPSWAQTFDAKSFCKKKLAESFRRYDPGIDVVAVQKATEEAMRKIGASFKVKGLNPGVHNETCISGMEEASEEYMNAHGKWEALKNNAYGSTR